MIRSWFSRQPTCSLLALVLIGLYGLNWVLFTASITDHQLGVYREVFLAYFWLGPGLAWILLPVGVVEGMARGKRGRSVPGVGIAAILGITLAAFLSRNVTIVSEEWPYLHVSRLEVCETTVFRHPNYRKQCDGEEAAVGAGPITVVLISHFHAVDR